MLDEQGLAVATAQEASVRSRKALADRTKEFRRGAAAEVSKEVAPLLKSYQEEIDRLTTRRVLADAVCWVLAVRPACVNAAAAPEDAACS